MREQGTNITEEAKKIIEAEKQTFIDAGRPSVAYISGMMAALTNPELLKAQGLSSNQWISVKQLPEKDGLYITSNGEQVSVSKYSDKYKIFASSYNTYADTTHWMPLPSPPTDDNPFTPLSEKTEEKETDKIREALLCLLDYPKEDLEAWANGTDPVVMTFLPHHIKQALEALYP